MDTTMRPRLVLIGSNGNAYAILGLAKRAAGRAGWSEERWVSYKQEATAGDYDHLLQTTMKYFDVE